jgi:hypothetical protein
MHGHIGTHLVPIRADTHVHVHVHVHVMHLMCDGNGKSTSHISRHGNDMAQLLPCMAMCTATEHGKCRSVCNV